MSVPIEAGAPIAGHFLGFIPEHVGERAPDDTRLRSAPCRFLVCDEILLIDVGAGTELRVIARLDDVEAALKQAKAP